MLRLLLAVTLHQKVRSDRAANGRVADPLARKVEGHQSGGDDEEARGTPAMPLLVSIRTSSIVTCCGKVELPTSS